MIISQYFGGSRYDVFGTHIMVSCFFGNLLPNIAIPMAFIAHSDRNDISHICNRGVAFYNVHYNPDKFPSSTVWLDGKLTEEEIKGTSVRIQKELQEIKLRVKSWNSQEKKIGQYGLSSSG